MVDQGHAAAAGQAGPGARGAHLARRGEQRRGEDRGADRRVRHGGGGGELVDAVVGALVDPQGARIAEHWRDAEAAHDARRDLADYLVSRLRGKRSVMYEVGMREMPERSLLCLKRNVDDQGQWAFGKEFIAILRERPLPKIEGREGAAFCIQWGWVSADSDGPVEWCKPVPQAEAHALAERYPELTLRTEPAHREAFVALPAGYGAVQWNLACESLDAWMQEQRQEHEG